jgi:hypothetical protein
VTAPEGFAWTRHGREVRITHHGRHAITLRGAAAARFLAAVEDGDPQELMARATRATGPACCRRRVRLAAGGRQHPLHRWVPVAVEEGE